MKSAIILLASALAISIGPTMHMEGSSRSRVSQDPWLNLKIAHLRQTLNEYGLEHLHISHDPYDGNEVMLTNRENAYSPLGSQRVEKILHKILSNMNVDYEVHNLDRGYKSHAFVTFKNATPNARPPLIPKPSEGSSSQAPPKKKLNLN